MRAILAAAALALLPLVAQAQIVFSDELTTSAFEVFAKDGSSLLRIETSGQGRIIVADGVEIDAAALRIFEVMLPMLRVAMRNSCHL